MLNRHTTDPFEEMRRMRELYKLSRRYSEPDFPVRAIPLADSYTSRVFQVVTIDLSEPP